MGGVHQARVKINHWISLRCTLFPIKMPMTFCKNIKSLISIDKKSRGNLHQVLYQWGWFEETPPPQQYLFHLLIPTWNRQQDPKRRLYLSHFLPRLRTSGLPQPEIRPRLPLCKGIMFQEDQNWVPWNSPPSVCLFLYWFQDYISQYNTEREEDEWHMGMGSLFRNALRQKSLGSRNGQNPPCETERLMSTCWKLGQVCANHSILQL